MLSGVLSNKMQRQQFTEQQQQITQEQRVSRVEQQVTRQVTSQQRGKCLVRGWILRRAPWGGVRWSVAALTA